MAQTEFAGAFIQDVRRSARAEVQEEYEKREATIRRDYGQQLASARAELRKAQDEADAARICSGNDREAQGRAMAQYRRGSWTDLVWIAGSAISGLAAGYAFQKAVDLRFKSAPVGAVLGAPGVAFGAGLDESMTARAVLAVGGTMFAVGTFVFTQSHPEPKEETV